MAAVSEEGTLIEAKVRKAGDLKKGFPYFRDRDILVAKITPCFENGKRWLATNLLNGVGFGSTEFHILRAKENVLPEWIYYLVSLPIFREYGTARMTGTAGQKRIPTSFLKDYIIPVPPIEVQGQIIKILQRAERLKVVSQEENQLASKIIQSVFLKMFDNYKIIREQIRNHVIETEVRKPKKEPNKPFIYVDIASIDNTTGRIVKVKEILGKDAPSRARKVIRAGDVIISTVRPNLNATALVSSELDNQICSTGFCVLRCKLSINPRYLYAFTRRKEFINTLSAKMKGASYPAVTNDDVLDIMIPVPSIELQNKFSNYIQQTESVIEKQRQSTQEINKLFQSLLHKAFKGELVAYKTNWT